MGAGIISYRRKLRFFWLFYLDTLKLSIPITFVCAFLFFLSAVPTDGIKLNSLDVLIASISNSVLISYLLVGIVFDFLYKEFFRKEQYYFYYNAACTKLQLWLFTYCIAILFCVLLNKIVFLWQM